jgi:hypothetical protein
MRCGEWLRAWPTAGRLASKGIANHVALRLKLRVRGVFWQPNPCQTLAHAVEFPIRYRRISEEIQAIALVEYAYTAI